MILYTMIIPWKINIMNTRKFSKQSNEIDVDMKQVFNFYDR